MEKLVATVAVAVIAGTALVASLAPVAAYADNFEALCKAGSVDPEADKLCKCTSGKVAAADRAATIAAMTAINGATTKGTPLDPSTLPADLTKGMSVLMEAQAQCM